LFEEVVIGKEVCGRVYSKGKACMKKEGVVVDCGKKILIACSIMQCPGKGWMKSQLFGTFGGRIKAAHYSSQ
jgi:hypothetical protein